MLSNLMLGVALLAASVAAAEVGPTAVGTPFDIQKYIGDALAGGAKTVTVPPGRYRVTPKGRVHLSLRGLHDVTIDCTGVEMICTETTLAVGISDCTNLTVRGLTVDYDPLPFTQGRITTLSADHKVHDIELFAGYPPASQVANFKYEIFDAKTRELATYDHNPAKVEVIDEQHLRLTMDRGNPNDGIAVGNIVVIGADHAPHGKAPHTFEIRGCANLRLEHIDVFASNAFGFVESDCDATIYDHCRIDRRAPETDLVVRADPRIRSLDADAFHSARAVRGPHYLGCYAKWMGDDAINIHGSYNMVTACHGAELRVLANGSLDLKEGDGAELFAFDGRRLPDAKVLKREHDGMINADEKDFVRTINILPDIRYRWNAQAWKITLDREVDLARGSLISSTKRMGNGFLVQGCEFGENRSRGILIKASDGQVIGNKIIGSRMAAVLVCPEYWWLESGSSNNVEVRDNEIVACGQSAIRVEALNGSGKVSPAGAHNNITVSGNHCVDCPLPNLTLSSILGLKVTGNVFTAPTGTGEPIRIVNCDQVTNADNRIDTAALAVP